jgi:hypothetical protein
MLKIFLTLVALILANAVSGSALAAPACWKCCPGSGHTPEGHCGSVCSDTCSSGPLRLMRNASRCADEYKMLACNGPRCNWVCNSAKR